VESIGGCLPRVAFAGELPGCRSQFLSARGIDDILIITGRGKQAIERHFDKSYELEENWRPTGSSTGSTVQDIADLADIHYVRQKERNRLGDAVMYARKHVGDEPFALLLGDTIVENHIPCTQTLIEQAEKHNSSTISLERVPWEQVPSYGVADIDDSVSTEGSFPVHDFVEKPPQDEAPSNLAITGWYVLTPDVFEKLAATEMGVGVELQLTDAIRKLDTVRGVELQGDRYDIGNIPSWLQANLDMALHHDDGEMHDAVQELLAEYRE